jgi:hypothetical protein
VDIFVATILGLIVLLLLFADTKIGETALKTALGILGKAI